MVIIAIESLIPLVSNTPTNAYCFRLCLWKEFHTAILDCAKDVKE